MVMDMDTQLECSSAETMFNDVGLLPKISVLHYHGGTTCKASKSRANVSRAMVVHAINI
jgi:hypothetical protein